MIQSIRPSTTYHSCQNPPRFTPQPDPHSQNSGPQQETPPFVSSRYHMASTRREKHDRYSCVGLSLDLEGAAGADSRLGLLGVFSCALLNQILSRCCLSWLRDRWTPILILLPRPSSRVDSATNIGTILLYLICSLLQPASRLLRIARGQSCSMQFHMPSR